MKAGQAAFRKQALARILRQDTGLVHRLLCGGVGIARPAQVAQRESQIAAHGDHIGGAVESRL